MRNRLFVPDTNRGSIGTPSALSNAVFAFFPRLITSYRKIRKCRETIFWQFGSRLGTLLIFIGTSTLFHIFRRQVALQMCRSYVAKKTCTSGKV